VDSEFTRHWALRHGTAGLPVRVLYPPVEVDRFRSTRKRAVILSVGRFFRGRHDKRHGILIDAFRSLVDSGLEGWELHLAGGKEPVHAGDAVVDELRERAKGLPVHFHVDASLPELVDLYAVASIYWHATGFGVDEEAHPQQLEHFGIAIGEAMAAEAVPIVIGRGGPLEIVEEGRTGYFWRSIEELVNRTRSIAAGPEANRRRMGKEASEAVRRFSKERFSREVLELTTRILEA
jgi:glycosyltransferase involved in cell wall biosynthesis